MDLQPAMLRAARSLRRLLLAFIAAIVGVVAFMPVASATPATATAVPAASPPATAHASSTSTGGYQLVAADGGIFSFGDAVFHGSTGYLALHQPIVGMAPTVSGGGYWLVASDGGVFSFGSAAFHGSTGAMVLVQPIVGIAATPSGHGYWLVASDGGVFSFGDATFHGSAGALHLTKPIVGMTASATGDGYWLVASDGGVFSFGDAPYFGSAGALPLVKPIVGMSAPVSGDGYWLVASDGGIFAYGNATFYGSAGALPLVKPIVGIAHTSSNHGYWLVGSDGGIFAFGDAKYFGSTGALALAKPVVGMSATKPLPDALPATQMAFSVQPGNSTGGTAFGATPTVQIQDRNGARVMDATNDVNLSLTTPAGATLACDSNDVTAVAGVATYTGCDIDRPGTYTLTATSGALAGAVSASTTITVGVAAKLAFTTQPSGATGGTNFTTQPAVTIRDAGGNTVSTNTSSVALTLATPAGATLTCAPVSAIAGVATFAGCKIDLANTYTLTATDGALTTAVSNSLVVAAGPAVAMVFRTQPVGANGGVAFATQPQVVLRDAGGNTAALDTTPVSLTFTPQNGSTLVCTANPKAAVAGVAAFAGCNIDGAGTYTLTASDGVLPAVVSNSFTITAGPAAKLAFTTQPLGAPAGTAFGRDPVVTIEDAAGNRVGTDASSVTISLTTPGGATFACTANPQTAISGVATFGACQVSVAGTYTLTATDGSLTTAISTTFVIS